MTLNKAQKPVEVITKGDKKAKSIDKVEKGGS